MKKLFKLIGVGIIFFGIVAAGTWIKAKNQSADSVIKERSAECMELGERISKQIAAANYCLSDSECRTVNIRCPWGEGKGRCNYILTNKNHSASLLQKDAQEYSICMGKTPELKGQFDICAEQYKDKSECPDISNLPLKCIEGKCVEVRQ